MATQTPQTVKIYQDYVELTLANGIKKTITLADFKHALDKSLNIQTVLENILLPPNCYMIAKGLDTITICSYYVGEPRKVKFIPNRDSRAEVEHTIPFPNIVITNKLNKLNGKWGVVVTHFWATNKTVGQLPLTPILQADKPNGIWAVPLPNMYSDGRMCYGHNTMPTGFMDNNFRALDWYFRVFFNSSFNTDLPVPEVNRNASDWMKKLDKLPKFPYEELPHYADSARNLARADGTTTINVAINTDATATVGIPNPTPTPRARTINQIMNENAAQPAEVAAR